MTPFCSIVILNFQGEKVIEVCLEAVLRLNYPMDRYEIIVVDNASKDKSQAIINKLISNSKLPTITSVFLPKNLGFSAGNNIGIKKARGEYVALLNNDCLVDRNWLKELVKTAQSHAKIFAVNPKIYLDETQKIQNAGIIIFPNGYARDIGAVPKNKKQDYESDQGQYNKEKEIQAACAAATLYRKSIFDKIGYFNEDFFMYYEDVEISERARDNGYKIIYCPKAIAYHHHALSSKEWSPFFIYHSEKGRLLNLLLHYPLSLFIKEYLVFSIKAIMRVLIKSFDIKDLSKNIQYIKIIFFFVIYSPKYIIRRVNHF